MVQMNGVHAEEVKERYSVPPTQRKEPACKNYDHWKHIHHYIYVYVAWFVFWIICQHFSWMLRKLIYTVTMCKHNSYGYPLTEPLKEV